MKNLWMEDSEKPTVGKDKDIKCEAVFSVIVGSRRLKQHATSFISCVYFVGFVALFRFVVCSTRPVFSHRFKNEATVD